MKFYTEDEALDRVLGKEGTPLREQYDSEMRNFLMRLWDGSAMAVSSL